MLRGWTRPCLPFLALLVVLSSRSHAAEGRGARIVENLYDTELLDGGIGWAVGAFGAIYKTADGGRHWTAQKTPTVAYLFSVDFRSRERGVAVGKDGTILSTSDGGATWRQRPSGTDRNLFGVAFSSPKDVWAVGDWGAVLVSHDAGETWTDRSLSEDIVLTSVAWADSEHGLLAGEFGTVRVTSDGGASFRKASVGTEKTFFGAAYPKPGEMWVVGIDGLVLGSRDGGKSWERKHGRLESGSLEQLGFMEALRNPGLYDVAFAGRYGYVVGDVGKVLVTSDHGETWVERSLPAQMSLLWIRGVDAAAGGHALAVGANGLTARLEKGEVRLEGGAG